MAEKCFCDNCGEQVGLCEGQWVYYKPREAVRWIPFDTPITSDVKKLADQIKALQNEYDFSFDEAIHVMHVAS